MLAADEPLVRWDWLGSHTDVLGQRAGEHLLLTAAAFAAGTVIAAVLTAVVRRWRWTGGPITTLTTVLYTIPSLALFAALIPVFGVGYTVPVIALTTYSLVVLTPFLVTAFDEVDAATLEAAVMFVLPHLVSDDTHEAAAATISVPAISSSMPALTSFSTG